MRKTLRILVAGRVQGVGFRLFAVNAAQSLGLSGYVRNMESRQHVEVVASGEETQLVTFLDCLRGGPPGARVDSVVTSEAAGLTGTTGFDIRS